MPRPTFRRWVQRYRGHHKVKHLTCLDPYLGMAFAQLTYRERLRDIEAGLRAQRRKHYYMGIRAQGSCNPLANANKVREGRIYTEFAHALIHLARGRYRDQDFGVALAPPVYALDATTFDLCLSVVPWAYCMSTKAAINLHPRLDLRGNMPGFIHISDGKRYDPQVLDRLIPAAGTVYVMDRGDIDCARRYGLPRGAACFVIRARINLQCRRRYSHPVDPTTGLRGDQTIVLTGQTTPQAYPEKLRRIKYLRCRNGQDAHFAEQPLHTARPHRRPTGSAPLAGGVVFQMDPATPADQGVLRHHRERGQNPDRDGRLGLWTRGDYQKASRIGGQSVPNATGLEPPRF